MTNDPDWLASVLGPHWDEVEWNEEGELWDSIEGRWVR